MPAARRSSSSRSAATFVLTAVLGISGCANNAAQISVNDTPSSQPAPALRQTIAEDSAAAAAPRVQPAGDFTAAGEEQSAWCTYLKENAAADASVLRSPTLSGSVDDDQKGSVSLSLSVSSLSRAALIEKQARINCRRYLAETGLQKVVFLAPQTLSAAGYRARYQAVQRRSAELEKLRKRIKSDIASGNLAADKAAGLTAMIDGLYSDAAAARSEFERRASTQDALTGPAAGYSAELLAAESDLAEVDSKLRTADAFDVSLSAGYSDGDMGDGFDTVHDGVSGKVSFSMKLGAFTPGRYEHERRARDARIAAIRDQEGGALWQIRTLREAHLKAISGLEESQSRIDRAIAETKRFIALVSNTPDPEFSGPAIEARIRMVQLEADRAAVSGSLAEIRTKLNQLGNG